MASAALPPLPSIRAKQLDRASAIAPTDKSGNAENLGGAPADAQSSAKNKPSASISTDFYPIAPSSPSQSYAQRSKQLDVLHQKEQKVFGGLPPLESSVACNVIHQYISTTSAFLNSFIADANASHDGIDHKLTVLENQMALLESKIASMPDLFPEEEEDSTKS